MIYRTGANENVVLNGGFERMFISDDYRLWEENFSESNGQFGSVSLDEKKVPSNLLLLQAGNPWDAQVWQDLTPMQIDGLTMGGTWELRISRL